MKVIYSLIIPLLFLACSKDKNPTPSPTIDGAKFKVVFAQSGAYSAYSKQLEFSPGLALTDSLKSVYTDKDLNLPSFTFQTQKDVKTLKVKFVLNSKQESEEVAEWSLQVFRNDRVIDTKNFKFASSSNISITNEWSYSFK